MTENNNIEKAYQQLAAIRKGEAIDEQWFADAENMKTFEGLLFLQSAVSGTMNKKGRSTAEAYSLFHKKQNRRMLYIRIALSIASCLLLALGVAYLEMQNKSHHVAEIVAQNDTDNIYIEIGDQVYSMDKLQEDSSLSTQVQIKDGQIASGTDKTETIVTHRINVPKGRKVQIVLPDGSKVWLNSSSRLSYPSRFDGTREVTIEGEAYFDVMPSGQMFIVHSGQISTKVLGTSFNCNSYNTDMPCITLVKGKVRLTSATDSTDLTPGYQVTVTEQGTMTVQEANIEDIIGWIDNKITYTSVTIEEIMKRLQRWYDFSVQWEDNSVKQFKFDLYGDYTETLETIIERLALTGRVRIKYENDIVYISNAR
ncbi:MAG: FecR family protein [Marinifilaceae bacterium]